MGIILSFALSHYKQHCNRIEVLVHERLNVPAVEIFSRLFKEQRGNVNAYCDKYDIDLASILEADDIEAKQKIGLSIIEDNIEALVRIKSRFEDECKQQSIHFKPIKITNGIEDCPWLTLFNSPNDLKWFARRTNMIIESLDPNNEYYDSIFKTIEKIKDKWIDPQSVIPNIDDYWHLKDLTVPERVEDLVVKHSGQ